MAKEGREPGLPRPLLPVWLVLLAGLLSSCAGPAATPITPAQTAGQVQATLALSPTPRPSATASSIPTSIPGFEGWFVINPQSVNIKTESSSLVMTLTHKALWFMEQRGVLLYKPVSGNFSITADVHTSRSTDPTQPPGGNGSVQLAGVMARNGNAARENYVFVVVGDDGNGLSVETKNTVDGLSKFEGPAWDSADAELRLCRFGGTISLYKRHAGANETWTQAGSFERADLPDTLQVGLNIYTDATPDVQARYDNLQIESVASQAECQK